MAHIRFRAAWAYNGRSLDEIPFKAFFGVYGSWVGLIVIFLVLIAQVSRPPFKKRHSQHGVEGHANRLARE